MIISAIALAAITLVAVSLEATGIRRTILVLATAAGALLSANQDYEQWAWLIYPILVLSIPAAVAVFIRDVRPKIAKSRKDPVVFVPERRETTFSWGWRETAALAVWFSATVALAVLSEGATSLIRVLLAVVAPIVLLVLLVFLLHGRRADPAADEHDST